MAKKTKSAKAKPNYLGVRTYVKDARTVRITRIKNAVNFRDGVNLNLRDTNDLAFERGVLALEQELHLQ